MKQASMNAVSGGVTAPRGFHAAGIHAGIKPRPTLDLALLVSEREGPVAGVFTTNDVVAAPVLLGRNHLRRGKGRAVLINSGNANACTGVVGLRHAKEMAALVAVRLGTPLQSVFVCSTGVIGQPLPLTKIKRGVPRLMSRLRVRGSHEAAQAILTTDTKTKEVAIRTRIAGRSVTVGGMAKGSGMIHPNMATMLAFITTDAVIARPLLQQCLRVAVDQSFDRISVDGDTSPNDTVLCLANGLAAHPAIRPRSTGLRAFQLVLNEVCLSLALKICRDGEGVTKVVRVVVRGARNHEDARRVAGAVGTSCLVKTAWFGGDANWGRILAAVGRSGASVEQHQLRVAYDNTPIVRGGVGLGREAERRIARIARRSEFTITVTVGTGKGNAELWSSDLSYEYVRINASYRS